MYFIYITLLRLLCLYNPTPPFFIFMERLLLSRNPLLCATPRGSSVLPSASACILSRLHRAAVLHNASHTIIAPRLIFGSWAAPLAPRCITSGAFGGSSQLSSSAYHLRFLGILNLVIASPLFYFLGTAAFGPHQRASAPNQPLLSFGALGLPLSLGVDSSTLNSSASIFVIISLSACCSSPCASSLRAPRIGASTFAASKPKRLIVELVSPASAP